MGWNVADADAPRESAALREARLRVLANSLAPLARGVPPVTLRQALQRKHIPTRDEVRFMARRRSAPVISVYLGRRHAARQVSTSWAAVFRALKRNLLDSRSAYLESLPLGERLAVAAGLDEIEDLLETLDERSLGIAIFTSRDQLASVVELDAAPADRLSVGPAADVAMLDAILEMRPSALVVRIAPGTVRVHRHHLGREDEVMSCELADASAVDAPDADAGGACQDRQWVMRSLALTTQRALDDGACDVVILAGGAGERAEVEAVLTGPVRATRTAHVEPTPGALESAEVESVLARWRAEQEEACVAAMTGVERRLLARGLPEVVESANRLEIRRLAVRSGLRHPGDVCQEHGVVSLDGGCCPYCGNELLPVSNVVDELLDMLVHQGVELTQLAERPELLNDSGGILAVRWAPAPVPVGT